MANAVPSGEPNQPARANQQSSRSLTYALAAGAALLLVGLVWWLASRTTLNVLGEDSSNIQAMERLKGKYESPSGVSIQFHKKSFEDAFREANQDLSSGTGTYDIILQYNFSLSSFVRNGYVYTLEDINRLVPDESLRAFEKDLFPNAWQEVGYYWSGTGVDRKAVAIGYPFAANTMLLVYNKRLFDDPRHKAAYREKYGEELAPPKDWAQFRQVAEYFTPPDKSTKGLCLQGKADGAWLYYEWCNFAYSMGGGVMDKKRGWEGDENTPLIIDSPETVAATSYYLSLKPYDGSVDYFATDATVQLERMRKKDIAMCLMWSDYVFGLVYGGSGQDKNEFGFAPIPGQKSMLAGGIYYINKHSRHAAEAAKYVMHLMQKDSQVELMLNGLCSPLRTAYDDDRVKALPYAEALRESLAEPRGVYMLEAGPESGAVQDVVTKHLQRLWRGESKSVETSLKEARHDIASNRAEIWKELKQPKE